MLRTPRQLNTLLRIRRRQEDLRALALAEARRRVRVAREQRQALDDEQVWALEEGAAHARGQFDAAEVRRYYQYERFLARLSVAKEAEVLGLEQKAEGRRGELEDAMKRRRIIERLRERRHEAWMAEMNKSEQILLDEVATNYAARNRSAAASSAKEKEAV